MKKECESVRKSFRKYLNGHLFKPEQIRVERHLKKCAFCRSEYQALRHSAETKKLLKDITPPEGMVQKVKEGVSSLSRLKKILYRPLWLAGIATVIALVYLYVYLPIRHYGSLEGVDRSDVSKTLTPPAASAPTATVSSARASAPAKTRNVEHDAPATPAPKTEPLVIVIAAPDEHTAMVQINRVMQEHSPLRKARFTDTVKEISGTMTAKELLTFVHRIESLGKITYSNSRLESHPAAQPLPFVMRLKTAPRAGEKPVPAAAPKPPAEPSERAAPVAGEPDSRPVPQPDDGHAEQEAPQTTPVR